MRDVQLGEDGIHRLVVWPKQFSCRKLRRLERNTRDSGNQMPKDNVRLHRCDVTRHFAYLTRSNIQPVKQPSQLHKQLLAARIHKGTMSVVTGGRVALTNSGCQSPTQRML